MKPNTWGWFRFVCIFAVLCLSFFFRYIGGTDLYLEITTIIIGLLLVAIFILEVIFWRCPSCEKPLPRAVKVKYCSHCGKEID